MLESETPVLQIDPQLTSEQLQRELQRVQSELDAKKTEIESLQNSAQRYINRITEVPKQKSEAQKRLKKMNEGGGSQDDPAETASRDETDLLRKASRIGTEAEIEMLNLESRHLELSSQLSPLLIDVANRQLKRLESQFEELGEAARLARDREVEEQIQLARTAAYDAHPSLAEMASGNQKLANQRKEIAERIVALTEETAKVTKQSERVEDEFKGLQKQVDEGLNKGTSLLLAESRRQLISPLESRIRLSQIQSELDNVKLMENQLQDESGELADPQVLIAEQLGLDLDQADEHLKSMAFEFIEARKSLIKNLLNDYRSYRRLLVGITVQRENLVSGIWATEELLSKHMVLVRSTEPIKWTTFKKSSQGARMFFAAEKWHQLGRRLTERARQRPYAYLMFGIGFVFLTAVVKRLKG